ncbi:hypothetical protein ACFLR0_00495 [Candidatus Bipolaricaulota bacterium]
MKHLRRILPGITGSNPGDAEARGERRAVSVHDLEKSYIWIKRTERVLAELAIFLRQSDRFPRWIAREAAEE